MCVCVCIVTCAESSVWYCRGKGGTLCWPDEDEDYYKVEFEQPLVLEEREQSIVQVLGGDLYHGP